MIHFPRFYLSIISFFFSTITLVVSALSVPIINEFVALNKSTLYDEDGQSSDWIEIFNPNQEAINLEGYFLTNNSNNLEKWRFPNFSLDANGYLIVFASGKDRDNGELHTNFRISKSAPDPMYPFEGGICFLLSTVYGGFVFVSSTAKSCTLYHGNPAT